MIANHYLEDAVNQTATAAPPQPRQLQPTSKRNKNNKARTSNLQDKAHTKQRGFDHVPAIWPIDYVL